MDIKKLYYIVKKLILPKFPWIEDFVWLQFYSEGVEYYSLEITANKEFAEQQVFMNKHEVEVEEEMKSLFNMLGPDNHQKFYKAYIIK